LQTGAVARVLFVNENSEANPTLRVNSETAVPIKALKGGTKRAPPVHNGKWRGASTATDETWQPYTQLDLMYDGTDFVILGNPLVEDGDTYSIYANGYNDFVNNCELSDWENVTISTNSSSPTVMPYDGFLSINNIYSNPSTKLYVNGVQLFQNTCTNTVNVNITSYIPVKKGDSVYGTNIGGGFQDLVPMKARYYKLRDYSNR
jgi:hypothetical protein